jgi:phytanoyl-CoA hydroxylase
MISTSTLGNDLKSQFETTGYVIVPSLLLQEEVEDVKHIFDQIHQGVPGRYEPLSWTEAAGDPLKVYPRVMHPHRFNAAAKAYMLHSKLWQCLETLFGEEPVAVQSMFYFKPPGARGQALHQDNFYLAVSPGTCMAAWIAIDDVDAENGGMYLVPHTHDAALVCPEKADRQESFTSHFVPVPDGRKAVQIPMKAGDALFFNGSLIHGSGPNRSKTRFRRSLIFHYAAGSTEKIGSGYLPLVRKDGSEVDIPRAEKGSICGPEWVSEPHY